MNSLISAMIVDDELHAREELEALLDETSEFIVTARCGNALEALQALKRGKPDVLFLDIQMPLVSGFELLSMIDEERMPTVVFVTAYDQYALKAFEENTVDYLLKPVEGERLAKTVQKLKRAIRGGEKAGPVYPGPPIRKVPCLISNRIKLVGMPEIEFIRSDVAGVYVVTGQGEFYTELTLKVLEARTELVRCHRQFLVNLDRVDEIVLHENQLARIQTKSGRSVPVSRRYLRRLKDGFGM